MTAARWGWSERFPFPSYPFGWYQVAYGDELAVGDVRPLRYFGADYVLWRDADGVAHVMSAFCPHLGAHLGYGGVLEDNALRCPFHGWTYGTDGACVNIPYSDRVNRKAKLDVQATVERNGLVMMWWHPHGDAPQWEIPEIPEAVAVGWTEFQKRKWMIRTVWQEMAENGVDSAHFRYVHGTATVPEYAFTSDGPYRAVTTDQKFETPRGVVDGHINSESFGPGFGVVRFSGIIDTVLLSSTIPIDEDHVETRFSFKVKSLGDERTTSNVGRALVADIEKQLNEDIPIWEHKTYFDVPALADTDGPIMEHRKWAKQFYAYE